jgi:hypothetical protein
MKNVIVKELKNLGEEVDENSELFSEEDSSYEGLEEEIEKFSLDVVDFDEEPEHNQLIIVYEKIIVLETFRLAVLKEVCI